jgi:hypothetical protein
MKPLDTEPDSSMVQLVKSRSNSGLALLKNLNQILILRILTNLSTLEKATRTTITTIMHTITTYIKATPNEAQNVIMGRPRKNSAKPILAVTMKNHRSTENTTNQQSHPRLSSQNLFRQIIILNRNRNREMLNVAKTALRRNR